MSWISHGMNRKVSLHLFKYTISFLLTHSKEHACSCMKILVFTIMICLWMLISLVSSQRKFVKKNQPSRQKSRDTNLMCIYMWKCSSCLLFFLHFFVLHLKFSVEKLHCGFRFDGYSVDHIPSFFHCHPQEKFMTQQLHVFAGLKTT